MGESSKSHKKKSKKKEKVKSKKIILEVEDEIKSEIVSSEEDMDVEEELSFNESIEVNKEEVSESKKRKRKKKEKVKSKKMKLEEEEIKTELNGDESIDVDMEINESKRKKKKEKTKLKKNKSDEKEEEIKTEINGGDGESSSDESVDSIAEMTKKQATVEKAITDKTKQKPPNKAGKALTSTDCLYLAGLSYFTKEESLKELFDKSIHIYQPKFGDNEKTKRYAFIWFSNPEEASAARDKMQGHVVDNNPLRIEFSTKKYEIFMRQQTGPESQLKLFVNNLAAVTKDVDLKELFSSCVSAHVVVDPETEKSKCYGFISFRFHEDAVKAQKKYDKTKLHDHQINVSFANRPDKPVKRKRDNKTRGKNWKMYKSHVTTKTLIDKNNKKTTTTKTAAVATKETVKKKIKTDNNNRDKMFL